MLCAPSENGLVFIGIAGKRSNPKETVQIALENAAKRVAVFHQVSGEYVSVNSIGSGAFDYSSVTGKELYYDEEGSKQYIDALEYDAETDTMEMGNALFIRATYRSAPPVPVTFRPVYSGKDKRPDWVDNASLQFDGYEVGIGYAGRRSAMADTFSVSYENAIFAIIKNIDARIIRTDVIQQSSRLLGYASLSEDVIYAQGSLVHFYVLDAWLDPANNSVWTLAIAKKSK
jgi:hypothetical protein